MTDRDRDASVAGHLPDLGNNRRVVDSEGQAEQAGTSELDDRHIVIARHFGLGRPTEAMVLHQHTSLRTWQLRTSEGSYLVKEIWESRPPYWSRKARAMTDYEQLARRRGIPIPRGYAADGQMLSQIDDVGAYKVYEWLDHGFLKVDTRLGGWLGRTMANLHSLDYEDPDLTSASQWFGLFGRATWNTWLEAARRRRLDWHSHLRESLPCILDISDQVAAAWKSRSDMVVSHGDLEPSNVLDTNTGSYLVDWESVGWESASLELGRTLFAFGEHDLAFSRSLLDSYCEAGGRPPQIDESFGMRAVARKLGNLTELVRASVEAAPLTGWMQSASAIPRAVDELILTTSRSIEWSGRLAALLKTGR
jgi:Ser/Thr protein kinase RdoA (MazF antagonist)